MADFYERGGCRDSRREIILKSLKRSLWAFLGAGLLFYCADSFDKEKRLPVDSTRHLSASLPKSEIDWEQMHMNYYYYGNGPFVNTYSTSEKPFYDIHEPPVIKPEALRDYLREHNPEFLRKNPYKNARGNYE